MRTRKQQAGTIDHAVLRPECTVSDVVAGCRLGRAYGVASVCVRPTDVAIAHKELAGSGVKVAAVVGFPHGAHRSEVKALEARLAIEDGAVELDMVNTRMDTCQPETAHSIGLPTWTGSDASAFFASFVDLAAAALLKLAERFDFVLAAEVADADAGFGGA